MQFLGLTGALISGKMGGLVGTRGRAGNQLRARIIPRQVITPSSSQARAVTGAIPSLWRMLTPGEQSSWAALAAEVPTVDTLGQVTALSGYALYVACTRRLITVGIIEPLGAAHPPSSVPAVYGFAAMAVPNDPIDPTAIIDLQLTTAEPLPNNFLPVVRASAALSPTRRNVRPSDLRVIQAGQPWPSQPQSVFAAWQAVYGTLPPGGTITFELCLIDPLTGFHGAPVRATAPFAYRYVPPPTPGTVIIQVEGVTVAVIPGTYVESEGEPVAN